MLAAEGGFKLRELHTPSAFEGAVWAMLGIKDARTILHSPPGCYINHHTNAMVNDWLVEMYTSNLPYSAIMQGGEDRLEATLRKVARKSPAALCVITAPPLEVVQDDVEGVARKVGYDNTVVVRPPMGGTVADGKEAAFCRLLDIMPPPKHRRPRSVNIIGPTFSTFNWMADVVELRRMLAGIGVDVNTVMTAGATIEQIKRAPEAALNLCIYPFDCGLVTAQKMQERFGIPYQYESIPVGFESSARWLEGVAAFFDIDASAFLKASIDNAFEFIRSPLVFSVTFEMSAALSFENHNTYAVGIAEFLSKEAGVDIVMSAVSNGDAAGRIRKVCDQVLLSPTLDDKRDKLVETSPMAIFGNFYDKKISMDAGFRHFIFADIPSIGYLSTETCPFMGFLGAKYLIQCLVNEVFMGIFLETKGDIAGPIAVGNVHWDIEAEVALQKVSKMVPHFVRTFAIKKLHTGAETAAKERGGRVTVDIVREMAEKYTPTRFKAKFSSAFDS